MVIRRKARGWSLAGALIASGALIVGCGGSSEQPVPHQPQQFAHGLTMEVSVSESLGASQVVVRAAGAVAAGGRGAHLSLDMVQPSFGGGGSMPVLVTNGTIYEQLPSELAQQIPGGRPWLALKLSRLGALSHLPGLNPFLKESLTFANPMPYVNLLRAAAARRAAQVGHAEVNGKQTTHYRVPMDLAKLLATAPSDPSAAQTLSHSIGRQAAASTAAVDIWVDRSGKIRRVQAVLKRTYSGQRVSVEITEDITGYGNGSLPAAPSAAETTDLLSLVADFNP